MTTDIFSLEKKYFNDACNTKIKNELQQYPFANELLNITINKMPVYLFGSAVWRLVLDEQKGHDFDIVIKNDIDIDIFKYIDNIKESFENNHKIKYLSLEELNFSERYMMNDTKHYELKIHYDESYEDIDIIFKRFDNNRIQTNNIIDNNDYECGLLFYNVEKGIFVNSKFHCGENIVKEIILNCKNRILNIGDAFRGHHGLHRFFKLLNYGFKPNDMLQHILSCFENSYCSKNDFPYTKSKEYFFDKCYNETKSELYDNKFTICDYFKKLIIDNQVLFHRQIHNHHLMIFTEYFIQCEEFDFALWLFGKMKVFNKYRNNYDPLFLCGRKYYIYINLMNIPKLLLKNGDTHFIDFAKVLNNVVIDNSSVKLTMAFSTPYINKKYYDLRHIFYIEMIRCNRFDLIEYFKKCELSSFIPNDNDLLRELDVSFGEHHNFEDFLWFLNKYFDKRFVFDNGRENILYCFLMSRPQLWKYIDKVNRLTRRVEESKSLEQQISIYNFSIEREVFYTECEEGKTSLRDDNNIQLDKKSNDGIKLKVYLKYNRIKSHIGNTYKQDVETEKHEYQEKFDDFLG